MKALFVHGHKFVKYNGIHYSKGQFSYKLWQERYLRYFDEIFVASRCMNLDDKPQGLNISSGDRVNHIDLPESANLKTVFEGNGEIEKIIKNTILSNDIEIVIARLPSINSLKAIKIANKLNKKVIIEMVGDPFDAIWNHGSIKGKLFAPINFMIYKYRLKKLDNIIFVTENYLQNKYKKDYKNFHTTNISNVNIGVDDKLKPLSIKEDFKNAQINIALIGSYSAVYKGIETAIKTISILRRKYNIDAKLSILGSGNKERYNKVIKELKIENYIDFVGVLESGDKVLSWLDNHDFYIQPSLTEGLPRGLIEAMSRGLPAVATNVGGIPELLKEEAVVKVKDAESIATKIYIMIVNPYIYKEHSIHNLNKSKEYSQEYLQLKRDKFYKEIFKKMSEE